jgi:ferredoxin-NADP reductase
MWKWYDATIAQIEQATPQTRRFWLELSGDESIQFKAGQFITLDLPISDKRLKRWRSYSIASVPPLNDAPTRLLELCIVRLENGAATTYLFDNAVVGTPIRFKGADGTFTLKNIEKDLVMICTGTGIAPFRSMIGDIFQRALTTRPVHLIFGTRTENDILYRAELEALAAKYPNFKYDIVLSRQSDWTGFKGHLHQVYLNQYAEKRTDVHFYLCGWSNMIDEAIENLILNLGYDKSQVHFELYG